MSGPPSLFRKGTAMSPRKSDRDAASAEDLTAGGKRSPRDSVQTTNIALDGLCLLDFGPWGDDGVVVFAFLACS
jgi:hypothetical protein